MFLVKICAGQESEYIYFHYRPLFFLEYEACVVLAALACAKLFPSGSIPPKLMTESKIVDVAADGRCFWSAVWLGVAATKVQLLGWFKRGRTANGFAYHKEDISKEKDLVCHWALRLTDMPRKCHERLVKGKSSEREDIDTWNEGWGW